MIDIPYHWLYTKPDEDAFGEKIQDDESTTPKFQIEIDETVTDLLENPCGPPNL